MEKRAKMGMMDFIYGVFFGIYMGVIFYRLILTKHYVTFLILSTLIPLMLVLFYVIDCKIGKRICEQKEIK